MKLRKRLMAFAMAAAVAVMPSMSVYGQDGDMPELPELVRVASERGTIQGVEESTIEGMSFMLLETENGPVNFRVTEDTFVRSETGLTEGTEVVGFYNGQLPVIMIFPPQYAAEAVVELSAGESVKGSVFDENLVSKDGSLKLNIGEDTEMVWQDGTAFEGSLEGMAAIVVYGVSTRSIPAQTTPDLVVVLPNADVAPMDVDELPPFGMEPQLPGDDIGVEEEEPGFNDFLMGLESDDMFIRLRAVMEITGLDGLLGWNQSERTVTIGDAVSFRVGETRVNVNGISVELSAAPQIINGSTYVPIDFFTVALALLD